MTTIYLDFIGGRYEARYWHTDEHRYFRFASHDAGEALSKAARHAGYRKRDCKIVRHY